MTTTAQENLLWSGFVLPDDLSGYIGKKTLVKLILEASEELNARISWCDTVATESAGASPALMLTLLTYCYATGVYASTDIELGMQNDQMIRYLCAKSCLTLPLLREFRRYNRDRLQECLAAVLRRVWDLRFSDVDGRWLFAPDFTAEAEQRVIRAVRADSMAMDW